MDTQLLETIIKLQSWHNNNVAQLKVISEMDEETKVQFEAVDGEKIVLKKEDHKGFKMGVLIALEMIGKFPVEISNIDDDDEN